MVEGTKSHSLTICILITVKRFKYRYQVMDIYTEPIVLAESIVLAEPIFLDMGIC